VRGFEAGNKWSPAFVAEARKRGMPVYAYTVNDEPTMRHLIEIGVTGIESDALVDLVRVAKDFRAGHLRVAADSRP
jgi:glycerophosphoryl diester phosphodiesterase